MAPSGTGRPQIFSHSEPPPWVFFSPCASSPHGRRGVSVGGPSLALVPVANIGRREKVGSLPANLSGS